MDKQAKTPKKVKDLDPKDRARNVIGGICPFFAVGAVNRATERVKGTVRRVLNPR